MPDALMVLAGAVAAMAIGASFGYYRFLRQARREYEEAKDLVEDIVLSFDRQLKREAKELELVAYKVEGLASRGDGALNKVGEIEGKLKTLEIKVVTVLEDKEKLLGRLEENGEKLRDIVASQEAVTSKITSLEGQTRFIPTSPESSIEAVIPIRRDRALAPLTVTELAALEFLALEGPKTAPEIKERIKLSREHTARLMKKLYESGYLERNTSKIPFKYSVKKEMERILKRPESQV